MSRFALIPSPRCAGLMAPSAPSAHPADRQHWLKTQKRWQCRDCGKQYSVKVDTIFEDSALKARQVAHGDVAAGELQKRNLQLRSGEGYRRHPKVSLVHAASDSLSYEKQVSPQDGERLAALSKWMRLSSAASLRTCTPAAERNCRARMSADNGKTAVMGMLDRDTREVRTKVIPNVKRETLQSEILRQVQGAGTVYTDRHVGYDDYEDSGVHSRNRIALKNTFAATFTLRASKTSGRCSSGL
jgi:transposase-like protein